MTSLGKVAASLMLARDSPHLRPFGTNLVHNVQFLMSPARFFSLNPLFNAVFPSWQVFTVCWQAFSVEVGRGTSLLPDGAVLRGLGRSSRGGEVECLPMSLYR